MVKIDVPCNIGDVIYHITKVYGKIIITPTTVTAFYIDNKHINYEFEVDKKLHISNATDFGKVTFTDHNDALVMAQKLKNYYAKKGR